MAKIGTWSTTAGNNNATPPDGWPEGQAPSTVNDCAREMMAAIRTYANNAEYFDTGNTPSYLSSTTFSLASADTANFHIGRRIKLFDASTLYGTIASVSSTFVSVQLDSGALTSSLSSVALGVIRATNNSLPVNVFTHQNVIHNACYDIWQRGTSFSCGSGYTYLADRFALRLGGGEVTAQQSTRSETTSNVPALAICGQLIPQVMKFTVAVAVPSMTASAYALIQHIVEGYDWRKIAHRPNHLSMYVNTNRSGIYSVSLRSISFSALYVTAMTIDTVNTWQRFNFAIPEAPFGATWNYAEQAGVRIGIALAGGSEFATTSANEWTTTVPGGLFIAPSQVNFMATAGNTFALGPIKLEAGSFGTPLDITTFTDELHNAKRFFQVIPDGYSPDTAFAVGQAYDAGNAHFLVHLPQEMRRAPVATVPAVDNFIVTDNTGTFSLTASAVTVLQATPSFLHLAVNVAGDTGLTAGNAVMLRARSTGPAALIQLNTELD